MPKQSLHRVLRPPEDSLMFPKSKDANSNHVFLSCSFHLIFPLCGAFTQWNSTGNSVFNPSYLHPQPQRMKLSNITAWHSVSAVNV